MPKLIQINQCLNLSTGKIVQQIGELAISKGWESWIAYSGREMGVLSRSNLIRVGNYFDACVHYVSQYFLDNEGLNSSYYTYKLLNRIREIQPDIVHLHNIHDHWLNYRLLFDYLNHTEIKVVWTFHDCWAFTGHCFHFSTVNCDRWKTNCYKCPLKHEYPNTLFDHSRNNFDIKKRLFGDCKNLTIVPCSDWMCSFVKESFLRDKNIQVIKNGIDLNVFRPSFDKLSMRDGKFRILAVSNVWNKEKGLYDIVKLRGLLPQEDFLITVIGLNKSQVESLPDGIVGVCRTHNVYELVKYYSESDVLVNPTYADTFPTINLESLACGTPVITYRTGGSPESIDENTGIVVEQGNLNAMKAAIYYMQSHKLNSFDCRNRAEKYFDKDKCFGQYISLYEKILES